ncbi:MAG: nuclear transport factor 2 family protein [Gammaproteobacteria bacterium]|nr:nuclear transport factor 2 family protein [Gammaproteobacteria bacterium]
MKGFGKLFLGMMVFFCLPVATEAASITVRGPAGDVAALERRINQWVDGYNQGNVGKMMDVFSENFLQESQNSPRPLDKAQVAQSYTALFAAFDTQMVGVTEEIGASGNMAYDRGSFTVTLTPKAGGATITSTGHFLEMWRREHGIWKVQRLMSLNGSGK